MNCSAAVLVIAVVVSALVGQAASSKVRKHLLVSTGELAGLLGKPNITVLHVGKKELYHDEKNSRQRGVQMRDVAVDGDGIGNQLPLPEALVRLVRRLGIHAADRIVIYSEDAGL